MDYPDICFMSILSRYLFCFVWIIQAFLFYLDYPDICFVLFKILFSLMYLFCLYYPDNFFHSFVLF